MMGSKIKTLKDKSKAFKKLGTTFQNWNVIIDIQHVMVDMAWVLYEVRRMTS